MTNNADDQIAREWALRVVESAENAQPVSRGALAAARYVLDTTTPPTMSDIEWDDYAHAGLCAEHPVYGTVRMLEADTGGAIRIFYVEEGLFRRQWVLPAKLTPIPGKKIDLTPRREPTNIDESSNGSSDGAANIEASINVGALPRPEDVPAGEVWEVERGRGVWFGVRNDPESPSQWIAVRADEFNWETFSDEEVTLVRRLAPETTPDHPEFLETEEDYENAPDGTIVAQDGGKPFVLIAELWMDPNSGIFEHGSMSDVRRRVLRWGWKA